MSKKQQIKDLKIYNILQLEAQVGSFNTMLEDTEVMMDCPEGYDAPDFTWDVKKCAKQLKLDDDCLRCIAKQGSGFKTVMGTEWFHQGGKYYFEIFVNKGELLKIGVTRPEYSTLHQAFSDTSSGWAIYNGQTRHNSNSTGPTYGSKLKSGDIVGVALDMEVGTLSFYVNGNNWGIAFKDEELKKGQLVAAVAPITLNDTFSLRNLIKED